MIANLYRKIIPENIREIIYDLFLGKILRNRRKKNREKVEERLSKDIPLFYKNNKKGFSEENYIAARWIEKNGYSMFPYDFIFKYKDKIDVYECKDSKMKYIYHDNKKMYFPKKFSFTDCQNYYKSLIIEQDIDSPHRYNYDYFNEHPVSSWSVLDIGAAEGIFSLSIIDKVEKIYLFECDGQWLEALNMTFSPYKNKVKIINRYVSNQDSEQMISIDSFIKKEISNKLYYIKMDIEGAELLALKGAQNLISSSSKIYMSICSYHLNEIGEDIINYLKIFNMKTSYTKGLMAFNDAPPYFRKGVIYASK